MSICKLAYYSGLADCKALLNKVVGIGIIDKGTTFTRATFVTESVWKTNIASATTASRVSTVLEVLDVTRTTDDPTIETSALGKKRKTLNPAPSLRTRPPPYTRLSASSRTPGSSRG